MPQAWAQGGLARSVQTAGADAEQENAHMYRTYIAQHGPVDLPAGACLHGAGAADKEAAQPARFPPRIK